MFIGKQITLPPPQVQVCIRESIPGSHSNILHLEVVGAFENETLCVRMNVNISMMN